MASGCPVVAHGWGGALEAVRRGGETESLARGAAGGEVVVPGGVLFGEQTVAGFARAIELLEGQAFVPVTRSTHAAPFAAQRFDREFRAGYEEVHARWRGCA